MNVSNILTNGNPGVRNIKTLRRSIIIICSCILIVSGINIFPESKYCWNDVKKLVTENKARDIEVNKSLAIDNDKIIIKRVIIANDATYVRYSTHMNGLGWSFSEGSIKMYDSKQHLYMYRSGESSGKLWGQDGIIEYEKLDKDAKYIVLKLDWYDRKDEVKISLDKEGEASENK